ncbi:MAG: sulfatase-like hydrolase/transferase [Pirellulales bacterium]
MKLLTAAKFVTRLVSQVVLCTCVASLSWSAEVAPSKTAAAGSPNVLLIVCDDLNSHVSPSGYQDIITPNMERLAKSSMRFTRAYCQYPVCGPSRSSFLSGLYPESTGVVDNTSDIRTVRPNTTTLPQWFKEHGYWTAGVGKIFHNTKTDPGEIAWNENHRYDNE